MSAAPGVTATLERHQLAVSLAAIAAGALLALLWPAAAPALEPAITPVLILLLTATFLAVPFDRLLDAWRRPRFLLVLVAVNFALVPLIVLGLALLLPLEQTVLVAVLLVLLAPCIDYVVAFTGLAGGAADRLLAATPLLMLGQLGVLALMLGIVLGGEAASLVELLAPLAEAFLLMIVLPLGLAVLLQLAGRRWPGLRRAAEAAQRHSMVPLMVATLFVVVASQLPLVRLHAGALGWALLAFVLFAVLLPPLGALAARSARLPVPEARAIAFSGVTRNSLVVLPLALALPPGYELAPAVVVTQTLVELVALVLLVRLVPRLLPSHPGGSVA